MISEMVGQVQEKAALLKACEEKLQSAEERAKSEEERANGAEERAKGVEEKASSAASTTNSLRDELEAKYPSSRPHTPPFF